MKGVDYPLSILNKRTVPSINLPHVLGLIKSSTKPSHQIEPQVMRLYFIFLVYLFSNFFSKISFGARSENNLYASEPKLSKMIKLEIKLMTTSDWIYDFEEGFYLGHVQARNFAEPCFLKAGGEIIGKVSTEFGAIPSQKSTYLYFAEVNDIKTFNRVKELSRLGEAYYCIPDQVEYEDQTLIYALNIAPFEAFAEEVVRVSSIPYKQAREDLG